MNTAQQWREAASELRRQAAAWDAKAEKLEAQQPICGVVSASGPQGQPLGCGWLRGHDGPHAWATLPTFTARLSTEGTSGDE